MEEKTIRDLLKRVNIATDKELINMIPELRKDASPAIISNLIKRWRLSDDGELRQILFDYFSDIKDPQALDPFMEAINTESDNLHRNALISVLWMSSMDASERLDELITAALEGDFMTAVEVSTVIENFDSEFNEDEIMDVIYRLDEHLLDEENEERARMLNNLKEVVNQLNVS